MLRSALAAGSALARRPAIWPTAARAAIALVPRRWWARWPPLPLPDAEWMRFRWETAFGAPDRRAEPGELIDWLEWCRESRAAQRYRIAGRRVR